MSTHLISSLKLTIMTMILFGVIYPLVITGIARFTAPGAGDGSAIVANNKIIGFEVIGQSFKSEKYFNGRPSAVGYNAAATGGSNKGPANPEYLAQVEKRIADFLTKNPGIRKDQIPVDLVTASGGGLDPHISPAAAQVQIARIARVRGLKPEVLQSLISQHTEQPLFGLFGTARVNVLKLNISLDKIK